MKKERMRLRKVLNSKKEEFEILEAQLLMKFLETRTEPVTKDMANFAWQFLHFLKARDYCIVNKRTLFCFPFGKMVEMKGVK
jgi:hypothetical protein